MKKLFLIFTILITTCLTACIEMAELIEIKADGSVDYTLRVSIPEFPKDKQKGKSNKAAEMKEDIEDFFSQTSASGLKFLGKEEKDQNGLKIVAVKLHADNLKDLNKIYSVMEKQSKRKAKEKGKKDGEPFSKLLGKSDYQVKKGKDGSIKVTRSFQPPKMKKKKDKDAKKAKMNREIEEALMNSFRYRFEVFLPTQALNNNADQVFGKNLRWEATLGYLLKNPLKIEFSYK